MLSPNTTANTSTGITTKIADVGPVSPKICEPTPNWNTSTMSPKVALTDSVFMMIALIGTSTERKAIASITAVAPRMRPTSSGKRLQQVVLEVERGGGVAAHHHAACPGCRAARSCPARGPARTRSIAEVSEVVSAGITSSSARRRSRAEVGVHEARDTAPGPIPGRCRAPSSASSEVPGLEVHQAPHLAHPRDRPGASRRGSGVRAARRPGRRCVPRGTSTRIRIGWTYPATPIRESASSPSPGLGARGPPVARRKPDPDPEERRGENGDDDPAVHHGANRMPGQGARPLLPHLRRVVPGEPPRQPLAAGRSRGRGWRAGRGGA